MKLKKLIVAIIVLAIGVNLAGCSANKAQSTGKQNVASGTSTKKEPIIAPTTTNFSVSGVKTIEVDSASSEGVYLSGYIEALTFSDDVKLKGYNVSTPKWGSINALPNGHFQYFAPSNICNDEIKVELRTNKGTKTVTIPIRVFTDKHESKLPDVKVGEKAKPVAKTGKSVALTSPTTGFKQNGQPLEITGKATGYNNGEPVTAYVKDMYGNIYPQSCIALLMDGKFKATIYIGDEVGHGIGETFQIWVKMRDGRCSSVVGIKRIT